MSHTAVLALAAGLGFGLSLIVAIGAQNAYVLRQGLRKEHVLLVVTICAASDVVLILLGIAGLGSLLDLAPWLVDVMRVAGAAFLLSYAALAARRAWRPAAMSSAADQEGASPVWPVAATVLALTWLNPHVYLDTVVLLGSVADTHGRDRWWFGGGAAAASLVWFASLGFGARLLRPVFARPTAWRVLDGLIAVVMAAIAATLVHGLATS